MDWEILTCLQNKKPQDVLHLAQEYIDHKSHIFAQMESIIVCNHEVKGWPEIVKKFTNPIDFPAVYTSVDSELLFKI